MPAAQIGIFMTKHVYIMIRGEHRVDGVLQEPVEVTAEGRYYYRGDKHYLLFDEFPGIEQTSRSVGTQTTEGHAITEAGTTQTGYSGTRSYQMMSSDAGQRKTQKEPPERISNLVKFNKNLLEIHKKGGTESVMRFEKDKMHMTQYRTTAGILELGTRATSLSLEESAHKIRIRVEYTLHAGGAKVQDSSVTMTVIPYPIV